MTFTHIAILGIVVVFLGLTFAASRYWSLTRRGQPLMAQAWTAAKHGPVPDHAQLPPTYVVYVLGSGGHTGEMCEMIKQQFRPDPNSHRRYIVTSGDTHSANAVHRLETLISTAFPEGEGGSWDAVEVVRARSIHQPLYTTWFSAMRSALSIVQALVRPPKQLKQKQKQDSKKREQQLRHPHLVITNGPGTGFVVCLVAFFLRMVFVVPADRCSVLFVETWAHVTTLSLTGKLFYYSRIADLFVVQHEQLARTTGERWIGDVTKYGNLLGIRKSLRLSKQDGQHAYE